MIKPIMFTPVFTGIKRKDIVRTMIQYECKQEELKQYKMDATYMFINGKLEMVASKETDKYLEKKQEYDEWLNEELDQ